MGLSSTYSFRTTIQKLRTKGNQFMSASSDRYLMDLWGRLNYYYTPHFIIRFESVKERNGQKNQKMSNVREY